MIVLYTGLSVMIVYSCFGNWCVITLAAYTVSDESSLSPRKLSRGIMESPAYVCLSGGLFVCLFVTTITK